MNKFSNILGIYDALAEKMETANSMSVRLAAHNAAKNFHQHLINVLVPMVKTRQDYAEALEILELYPEFSSIADYFITPSTYDWKAVWQGEPGYISAQDNEPAFYEDADYLLDPQDCDWISEECEELNLYEALIDLVEISRNKKVVNRCSQIYRESDKDFYDKQKGLTWKDMEDLFWLESVYR